MVVVVVVLVVVVVVVGTKRMLRMVAVKQQTYVNCCSEHNER